MLKKFKENKELSQQLAKYIIKLIIKNKSINLGCPGGRSLKNTYKYIGYYSYKMNIDLSKLKIFMMDEYVIKTKKNKYKLCNQNAHFSCVRYSYKVIQKLFNYKKTKNKLLKKNIFFPKIENAKNYDNLIKKMGGIDIFFLASGSTDGHVAFNNFKSKKNSITRIIRLSKETRTDNLKTFPKFKSLKEVPKYGVTVGLGTIRKLSKKAILVLSGNEKKYAAKIILRNKCFNKNWPSTIIYECKKNDIYVDMNALNIK